MDLGVDVDSFFCEFLYVYIWKWEPHLENLCERLNAAISKFARNCKIREKIHHKNVFVFSKNF